MAAMSPAMTLPAGSRWRPKAYDSAPIFSSSSWSGWLGEPSPKNDVKWPDTCTVESGTRVPLKTRTSERRPT